MEFLSHSWGSRYDDMVAVVCCCVVLCGVDAVKLNFTPFSNH